MKISSDTPGKTVIFFVKIHFFRVLGIFKGYQQALEGVKYQKILELTNQGLITSLNSSEIWSILVRISES